MERMRYYEPRRESFLEQQFSIDQRDFERNTGFHTRELSRLAYFPQRNQFTEVPQTERRRGIEVFWHSESSTLIVPPPSTRTITIKDLPVMAIPVVGFIVNTQPDVVIGCDRGARIYALAVHGMWSQAQEQRFPSLDGKMHFARLSTSLGLDVTSEALARILEASKAEANRQGKRINGKRPRIMFIDDLISSGATREQIMESLKKIGVFPEVDVSFAVMCGSGADVTGTGRRVSIPWHDNPDVIGVNYTRDGQPIPVRTEEARKVRRQLYRATKELVAKTK